MASVRGSSTSKAQPTQSESAGQHSQTLEFEDNRLTADLFGEFDAHLALIEDRLGVNIVAQGNRLKISGSDDDRNVAVKILNQLYQRLENGEAIGPGEIDGAIRHANAGYENGRNKKSKKRSKADPEPQNSQLAQIRTRKRVITARTPNQSKYIAEIEKNDLVFATGPAGTGKTYLCVAFAAASLERGETERIILSRPAVEAGERLGFLPGDMKDKVDPYLRPLYDALYDVLPPEKVERGLETGVIEIAPLAFMRGRTLSHSFIILDEAQNTTPMQMKMFLTRIGEHSKMVVTGDPSQVDLPDGQTSGLKQAISLLKKIDEIGHISFGHKDVVRRELVAKIVQAYDRKS